MVCCSFRQRYKNIPLNIHKFSRQSSFVNEPHTILSYHIKFLSLVQILRGIITKCRHHLAFKPLQATLCLLPVALTDTETPHAFSPYFHIKVGRKQVTKQVRSISLQLTLYYTILHAKLVTKTQISRLTVHIVNRFGLTELNLTILETGTRVNMFKARNST